MDDMTQDGHGWRIPQHNVWTLSKLLQSGNIDWVFIPSVYFSISMPQAIFNVFIQTITHVCYWWAYLFSPYKWTEQHTVNTGIWDIYSNPWFVTKLHIDCPDYVWHKTEQVKYTVLCHLFLPFRFIIIESSSFQEVTSRICDTKPSPDLMTSCCQFNPCGQLLVKCQP